MRRAPALVSGEHMVPLPHLTVFFSSPHGPRIQVRSKWGASAALDDVSALPNVRTLHGIDGAPRRSP